MPRETTLVPALPVPQVVVDMKLPQIRELATQLRFAPEEGRIWMDERRMVLVHSDTFADLRDELLAFLPRLAEVLRKHSVLIVIDNLESLLRETRWRDERWGDVIDALLSHDGPSRLVLTSRLAVPVGQSEFARSLGPQRQAKLAGRLLTLPVHALSLDETALLARQLPGLRALLEGDRAADGFQREAHRQLVCRMLRLVQAIPS